jgi:pimeloyl-ACP methyl ester carboxylesterase
MSQQGKPGAASAGPASRTRTQDTPGSPIRTIAYLHGFLSSGQSTKARFLRERLESWSEVAYHVIDLNPTPRDFETMTTTGQINRVRQYVLDHNLSDFGLVGSSFGGLIALHYAHRFAGVTGMLLLAPAVVWLSGGLSEEELRAWEEAGTAKLYHPAFDKEVPIHYDLQRDGLAYLEPVAPAAPAVIIHGREDTTVPIAHSRSYVNAYSDSVQLIEVEADHDLNSYLDLIWETTKSFLMGRDGDSE